MVKVTLQGDIKLDRFKDWQYFSQSQLRRILMDIRRQVSQKLMEIRGGRQPWQRGIANSRR